jgi:hypothetical protein
MKRVIGKLAALSLAATLAGCAALSRQQYEGPVFDPTTLHAETAEPLARPAHLDELLAKAADARIVLFGEDHKRRDDDEYIASVLPYLKRAGYGTLALELSASHQYLIDRYLLGRLNIESQLHGTMQGRTPIDELPTLTAMANSTTLLDAGRFNELQVVGVGQPPDYGRNIDASMREREVMMAQRIDGLAQHGRVVVVLGAGHVLKEPMRGRYVMLKDQMALLNEGEALVEPVAYMLSKKYPAFVVQLTDVVADIRMDLPSYDGHVDMTIPMR